MKSGISFKDILADLGYQIDQLSDADISKLKSGSYALSVKIVRKKQTLLTSPILDKERREELAKRLNECQSREEGRALISSHLRNKRELEAFAKDLRVFVSKQDNSEQITSNIVEATIGATLRSDAIRGEKST